MRRTFAIGGLAALIALPLLAAPVDAKADCAGRKTTGTIIGGVGGALLGNSISHGGGGAVIGGLGGAVVGHEIGRSGCRRSYRSASRSPVRTYGGSGPAAPASYVYYDQYGRPVNTGYATGPAYTPTSYACRTETRSFYDRGVVVQRPTQVCDR